MDKLKILIKFILLGLPVAFGIMTIAFFGNLKVFGLNFGFFGFLFSLYLLFVVLLLFLIVFMIFMVLRYLKLKNTTAFLTAVIICCVIFLFLIINYVSYWTKVNDSFHIATHPLVTYKTPCRITIKLDSQHTTCSFLLEKRNGELYVFRAISGPAARSFISVFLELLPKDSVEVNRYPTDTNFVGNHLAAYTTKVPTPTTAGETAYGSGMEFIMTKINYKLVHTHRIHAPWIYEYSELEFELNIKETDAAGSENIIGISQYRHLIYDDFIKSKIFDSFVDNIAGDLVRALF